MIRGRRTFTVKGACPRHGEDVNQTLENATFSEARSHKWDCPHEEDGNQSVQAVEILDLKTHKVVWQRPFTAHRIDNVEHRDCKFD
jgi:hypothetical protein